MTSYITQSRLGEWFGVSPVAVGKILIAEGLKDRYGATEEALLKGFAKEATKNGIPFFVWDAERTARIIDEHLGDVEKPFIDNLVAQVGEIIVEAERHRDNGDDIFADMLLDQATEGVPTALIGLIRTKCLQHEVQT